MGVYIKGANMPCDCLECMVAQFCKEYEEDDKRPYGCPLVEVKAPHGRLIDANNLIENIELAWDMLEAESIVEKERTVIEAENK